MENITFNLTQLHRHGTAFFEFLALRKQFFVDQLGWDIPHDDDVETASIKDASELARSQDWLSSGHKCAKAIFQNPCGCFPAKQLR